MKAIPQNIKKKEVCNIKEVDSPDEDTGYVGDYGYALQESPCILPFQPREKADSWMYPTGSYDGRRVRSRN